MAISTRPEPLLSALRAWLGGWPGIGRVAGVSRQGFDLQLARHGAEGWQATFYPAGRTTHFRTAAVGSAQASEPWVAVQWAVWRALNSASSTAKVRPYGGPRAGPV